MEFIRVFRLKRKKLEPVHDKLRTPETTLKSESLPIASEFASRANYGFRVQTTTKTMDSPGDCSLISRPRPVSQDVCAKNFFSRGTISSENTRIISRKSSAYCMGQIPCLEEKSMHNIPGRNELLKILVAHYPTLSAYIDRRKTSEPQSYSHAIIGPESLKSEIESDDESDMPLITLEKFPSRIPAYTNLCTPPDSPSTTSPEALLTQELDKLSILPKNLEYHQIRQILIKLLREKGDELPHNLKQCLQESYFIYEIDIKPEEMNLSDVDELEDEKKE